MSKSLGNQTFPQDVIKASGADILRLWVASVDYSDDQRIGPEILKTVGDNYRKLRNTMRWMLGTLAHYSPADAVGLSAMGELERLMLHRLAELDADGARRLRQFRLCARRRGAVGVHERRSLGVLFRHPQGRALLRSALERQAARRAGGDRPYLPRRRRSGWRRSSSSPRRRRGRARDPNARLRASRTVPAAFPPSGATRRSRRNGRRSAASVRSSPARSRSRAPTRRSARRWRRSPRVYVERTGAARRARRRRFRRSLHHLGHRDRAQRERRPKAPFASPIRPASRSWSSAPRASNARARGAISIPRPPIPNFPTSARATRRRCAN